MKWYNKSKKKMIDLSKVDAYEYTEKGGFERNTYLTLFVSGCEMKVSDDEAEEIYNKLQEK